MHFHLNEFLHNETALSIFFFNQDKVLTLWICEYLFNYVLCVFGRFHVGRNAYLISLKRQINQILTNLINNFYLFRNAWIIFVSTFHTRTKTKTLICVALQLAWFTKTFFNSCLPNFKNLIKTFFLIFNCLTTITVEKNPLWTAACCKMVENRLPGS